MRRPVWFALGNAILFAQETSTYVRSTADLNGTRVEANRTTETRSKTGSERTETRQSINGRLVPFERTEERILRDDPSGRVIERIIQQFDQTGNPGPSVKVRIEEQKRPGGLTIRTTTERGDVNGHMVAAERSTTETTIAGTSSKSETVIERPSLSGSFEPAEKRSLVRDGTDKENRQTEIVYRKGTSGFYPALRVVTQHSEQMGGSSESVAEYDVGSSGTLELQRQNAIKTIKSAEGSEEVQVDHFENSISGMRLQLREITERRPGAGGTVVETKRVRRPSVADPGVLGPPSVVSETVCKGKCP